jgi:hypothetical protein
MRIIKIMSLLMRKGLTVRSLLSLLSNSLIVLVMFLILLLKTPLEMDLVWTIPTLTASSKLNSEQILMLSESLKIYIPFFIIQYFYSSKCYSCLAKISHNFFYLVVFLRNLDSLIFHRQKFKVVLR